MLVLIYNRGSYLLIDLFTTQLFLYILLNSMRNRITPAVHKKPEAIDMENSIILVILMMR